MDEINEKDKIDQISNEKIQKSKTKKDWKKIFTYVSIPIILIGAISYAAYEAIKTNQELDELDKFLESKTGKNYDESFWLKIFKFDKKLPLSDIKNKTITDKFTKKIDGSFPYKVYYDKKNYKVFFVTTKNENDFTSKEKTLIKNKEKINVWSESNMIISEDKTSLSFFAIAKKDNKRSQAKKYNVKINNFSKN